MSQPAIALFTPSGCSSMISVAAVDRLSRSGRLAVPSGAEGLDHVWPALAVEMTVSLVAWTKRGGERELAVKFCASSGEGHIGLKSFRLHQRASRGGEARFGGMPQLGREIVLAVSKVFIACTAWVKRFDRAFAEPAIAARTDLYV